MRVTKLFSFSSNWLRKWREFSDQSQSWGRELCYHFRLGALFVVLTYCIPSYFIRNVYNAQLSTPCKHAVEIKTCLEEELVRWGETFRLKYSTVYRFFFFSFFFFSTMALCNVLQFFVNTGDKRLSSIIVKGERIFQQDEGTDLCSYSNKLVTLWEAPAERGE